MNSLSWFLLGADLLVNLGGLFVAISALSGGALLFAGIGVFITMGDTDIEVPLWKVTKWASTVCITFAFLAACVPSKNTIYAIAASQMGEKMAQSEAVQGIATDATKALQQWIKQQLEPVGKGK